MVFFAAGIEPVISTEAETLTAAIVPVPGCVAVTSHGPGFSNLSVVPDTEQTSAGTEVNITAPPLEVVEVRTTDCFANSTDGASVNEIVCGFLIISIGWIYVGEARKSSLPAVW
jgi:hypothetical protein